MSVVVAIKDGDKVWMACDSQATRGYSKHTLSNKNNCKIIKPEKDKNTIVGVVGRAKMINAMSVQETLIDELTLIKDEFDYKYLVKTLVPKLFNIASEFDITYITEDKKQKRFDNTGLIFAHKNQLYTIDPDGFVRDIEDYCADGSGYELCLGYLNQHSDEDKKEAVIKAVKSSCQTDLYVNYPIIVMNTMDDEIIVIDK